jgi:hypothetical protein
MKFLPNDRLSKGRTMTTTPASNVQRKLDDDLRDQIELLNLKMEDADDAIEALGTLNANLNLRNAELQAKLEQEQQYRLKQSDNSFKLNQAEARIVKLEKDILLEMGNRDHFRSLVAQQDKLIKELREKMAKTADEHRAILEARKNEVDHLARQTIRLNEENGVLKTDNCHLQEINAQLNKQTPTLMEDNRKYMEQTTRLIEENRKLREEMATYACEGSRTGRVDSLCGGCISCLSSKADGLIDAVQKSLDKRTAELTHEQKVGMLRWQVIEALVEGMKKFKAWPCLWWNDKAKIIAEIQGKVDDFQRQINKERKEFYKLKD